MEVLLLKQSKSMVSDSPNKQSSDEPDPWISNNWLFEMALFFEHMCVSNEHNKVVLARMQVVGRAL